MTPCGMYSAAKHGLVAFARLLDIEAARFNVHVHVVCPGRVDTEFFAHESFKSRGYRPEAERTIPIEAVSAAVVDAVQRDRFMTYVPAHYGMLAWLAEAAPPVFRPVWRRLMASRVASARVGLREDAPH
jgi:short-subunit dehydrogenase